MQNKAIAAVLTAVVLVGACRSDIHSGIDTANDLLYQEQYVEAERLYRKLLARLEKSGELDEDQEAQHLLILDRLGKINALYLHDYTQAIADNRALVRHYPRTDQAFAARAMVADIYQHKLGDSQKAIDEYHKLTSQFPNRNETRWAQLQITQGYFRLKNYEQARTEAEALINKWPQSSEAAQARFQIANSFYVQGRYTEAIATYERLVQEQPDPSLASLVLFELGNCFQELGETERALAYFYASLVDHPNPLLVQRKIRRVRRRLHSSKPASSIFTSYIRNNLALGSVEGGRPKVDGDKPKPMEPPQPGNGGDGASAATPKPTPQAKPKDDQAVTASEDESKPQLNKAAPQPQTPKPAAPAPAKPASPEPAGGG